MNRRRARRRRRRLYRLPRRLTLAPLSPCSHAAPKLQGRRKMCIKTRIERSKSPHSLENRPPKRKTRLSHQRTCYDSHRSTKWPHQPSLPNFSPLARDARLRRGTHTISYSGSWHATACYDSRVRVKTPTAPNACTTKSKHTHTPAPHRTARAGARAQPTCQARSLVQSQPERLHIPSPPAPHTHPFPRLIAGVAALRVTPGGPRPPLSG